MTAEAVVLSVATALVTIGGFVVLRNDLRNDNRSRRRAIVEALLPAVGLAALVWWSWAA